MTSNTVNIRSFEEADRARVIELWHATDLVSARNDPDADIDRKVAFQPDLLLVAASGDTVVGTVMAGYDGHRGWINYLAVDPDQRSGGLGMQLMAEAESRLAAMGCPKVNLQVRFTNTAVRDFYVKAGYTEEKRLDFGKHL